MKTDKERLDYREQAAGGSEADTASQIGYENAETEEKLGAFYSPKLSWGTCFLFPSFSGCDILFAGG